MLESQNTEIFLASEILCQLNVPFSLLSYLMKLHEDSCKNEVSGRLTKSF